MTGKRCLVRLDCLLGLVSQILAVLEITFLEKFLYLVSCLILVMVSG